ncbi:hypothetical protein [Flavobacterium soyae]|uniref:hypothetical protein n=1 Tax=Flavobacterium soyae TaxID=2903098 RepID=UPI001E3DA014|nr:hypothetical protein [Flavobacterium soyae]MCD9574175.1 hypothetical protein [Flavobacterium soyae]
MKIKPRKKYHYVGKVKRITAYYNCYQLDNGCRRLNYSFFISKVWLKHFGVPIENCDLEIGLSADSTTLGISVTEKQTL